MADGLVSVHTLVDDMPMDGETYLCSHSLNKSQFGLQDDDPRQKPYPVHCMALACGGSELWYSNGPGVLVIQCPGLQALRRLEPYRPPSSITSLVCSPSCWGDEAVWCLDDLSNTLLLYHARSYQLCASYHCGDSNPLRDVFPVQRPAGRTTEQLGAASRRSSPAEDDQGEEVVEEEEEEEGDVCEPLVSDPVVVIHSEDAGTQILRRDDSLTDYCSVSTSGFFSEAQADGDAQLERSSSGALSSLASTASMAFSTDTEDAERPDDREPSGLPSPVAETAGPPEATEHSHSPPHLQALTVLPVSDTVWVPR